MKTTMLHLLPQPKTITLPENTENAFLTKRPKTLHLHPEDASHPAIKYRAKLIGLRLKADSSLSPFSATSDKATQSLSSIAAPDKEQAYTLHITETDLLIKASDQKGLLYALTTLEQILEQHPENPPILTIEDWPNFPIRYHHDDISRKQISTVADFKRILHHLARYKFTHYTIYIEDVLHFPSLPDIGEGRGKLMPAEVKAILAEAEKLGIEVFPTITLMGHHENLLSLPNYRPLATDTFQFPSTLDPAKPGTRELVSKMLSDACELFPSKYFHMGFDETQGDTREAFLTHANWCAEQLASHGKTPIMWIDRLYHEQNFHENFTHGKFGLELLDDLHPSIIPVVWCYFPPRLRNTHAGYLKTSQTYRNTWTLTGYNNWCYFIPTTTTAIECMRLWAETMEEHNATAFGSSQWGDHGYENHRDLPWHLFSAFADYAWCGSTADSASQPDRFQQTFYGTHLESIASLISPTDFPFEIDPIDDPDPRQGTLWKLHRQPHHSLIRAITEDPTLTKRASRDLKKIPAILKQIKADKKKAPREATHLTHWESALLRNRSVLERIVFAGQCLKNKSEVLSTAQKKTCRTILKSLKQARQAHLDSWLQNNKPENVEVSLSVFDTLTKNYQHLLTAKSNPPAPQYRPIDLKKFYNNEYRLDATTFPIGEKSLHGIPFSFADRNKCYKQLEPGESLTMKFPTTSIQDIHLLAAVPTPLDRKPVPGLRLELLRKGSTVYTEDLLAITHLCDWADVYRNLSAWGGGGYHHVDPCRVSILQTWHLTSLPHIHRFPFVGAITADAIRITDLENIPKKPPRIIALTLESPIR